MSDLSFAVLVDRDLGCNSSGNTSVSIHEFYPSKAEKGFERLGTLELKGILHIHSHYMQFFVALDHFQNVTVWDYHENTSTTWQLKSVALEVSTPVAISEVHLTVLQIRFSLLGSRSFSFTKSRSPCGIYPR